MIPINTLLIIFLCAYLFSSVAEMIVEQINARHLCKFGGKVPEVFRGVIDEEDLNRINRYTVDNTRLGLVQTVLGKIIFLVIILSGILPWLTELVSGLNFVLAGLIFFAAPSTLTAILGLPFDYYHSFVIEERYGFNTKTKKIWLSDLLKSLILSVLLGAFLLGTLLLLVKYAAHTWWIWAWAVFFVFQLLVTVLYPTLIAPLFNKFTPLEEGSLATKVKALAEKQGFTIKGIYQMDAGKRSRHTNAYFTGLGKTKRIVLFDSLIERHTEDEILAILAHEMGHFKKNHIKKQFAIVSIVSFVFLYVASKMIGWEMMFQSFGFSLMPAYAGLFLVGVLWEPTHFFLSPAAMAISRKNEREADLYGVELLKSAKAFSGAMKKLAKDNLANLRPHPLYVWFNYSHPPIVERIERVESLDIDNSR